MHNKFDWLAFTMGIGMGGVLFHIMRYGFM